MFVCLYDFEHTFVSGCAGALLRIRVRMRESVLTRVFACACVCVCIRRGVRVYVCACTIAYLHLPIYVFAHPIAFLSRFVCPSSCMYVYLPVCRLLSPHGLDLLGLFLLASVWMYLLVMLAQLAV